MVWDVQPSTPTGRGRSPIIRGDLTENLEPGPDGIQIVLVEVPTDHPRRRRPAIGVTAKMTNSMRQMRMATAA